MIVIKIRNYNHQFHKNFFKKKLKFIHNFYYFLEYKTLTTRKKTHHSDIINRSLVVEKKSGAVNVISLHRHVQCSQSVLGLRQNLCMLTLLLLMTLLLLFLFDVFVVFNGIFCFCLFHIDVIFNLFYFFLFMFILVVFCCFVYLLVCN